MTWDRKQITTQVSSYVAEEIKEGRGGKSECAWETRPGRMIRGNHLRGREPRFPLEEKTCQAER